MFYGSWVWAGSLRDGYNCFSIEESKLFYNSFQSTMLELNGDSFAEFIWRCILSKQLKKVLAVILGIMSAAILLAEATLLPRGVDLSLFSILVNSVKSQEVLVQVKVLQFSLVRRFKSCNLDPLLCLSLYFDWARNPRFC